MSGKKAKQIMILDLDGKDGGRMRNPDKIRTFMITSFIVLLTVGTPFISSILLVNGLMGKDDPSITNDYDFTENYASNPQYELKEAPSVDDFFEEYKEYCDWVSYIQNKLVLCEGTIQSVVPDFLISNNNGKFSLCLKGFLIIFHEGFIDNQHFEDPFYLHINSMFQNKIRLRENDEVEFKAIVKEKDGRIELFSPKHFNFYLRGKSKPMLRSDLLVSLNTATTFNVQHEKCKKCSYSVIPKIQNNKSGKNRVLICSKGIQKPEYCVEKINNSKLFPEICENDKSNTVSCSRIL